jgi:hypothetical protein
MLAPEIIGHKSDSYFMARFMLAYLMPPQLCGGNHNMEISKKEGNMNRLITGALTGAVLMTAPLAASALVIDINTYLTGSSAGSNVTVATLTLTQNGNSVDFRFENSIGNLGTTANNAYISGLLFSYDGSPLLTSSSFVNFGGTQLVAAANFAIDPPGKTRVTIFTWIWTIPPATTIQRSGLPMANTAPGQSARQTGYRLSW